MKKPHELRIGNYSVYIQADDMEQAEENRAGIINELEQGCEVFLTGFVLEGVIEATDEGVAGMLRKSRGLH